MTLVITANPIPGHRKSRWMAPGFVKLSFNLSAFADFIFCVSATPDEIQCYQARYHHKPANGTELALGLGQ